MSAGRYMYRCIKEKKLNSRGSGGGGVRDDVRVDWVKDDGSVVD